ncbi:MAG: sporulation integral membrane protein YtvI [Clostridia bacterium]|nr:sporulation integral membrane protein YtvI [Clostridia bacterium]
MKNDKGKYEYYKKIGWKVVTIVIALLTIFLSYKLAIFYIPFVIAYLISRLLDPLIRIGTNKLKLNRKFASIIAIILLLTTIGSLITWLIISLINEITMIVSQFNINYNEIQNLLTDFISKYNINISVDNIKVMISENSGTIKNIVMRVGGGILNFLTSIPTMIMYAVITILATIFMCFDKEYVKDTVKKHVPKVFLEKVKKLFKETCGVALNYIKAESKLSLICFTIVLIGFWIMKLFGIQVDYPTSTAIITGIVDILPLLGAGTVLIPYAIYSFIVGNTAFAIGALIIWGIWTVLKQIIEPKVVSKQMGVHPIFTLIAMYTGYKLIGVFGLMLGPITLLILKNIFKTTIDKGVLKSFFELE